jgi:hypothetical protein
MANMVIQRALEGYSPGASFRWDRWLNSTPPPVGSPVHSWEEFASSEFLGVHEDRQEHEEKHGKKAKSSKKASKKDA